MTNAHGDACVGGVCERECVCESGSGSVSVSGSNNTGETDPNTARHKPGVSSAFAPFHEIIQDSHKKHKNTQKRFLRDLRGSFLISIKKNSLTDLTEFTTSKPAQLNRLCVPELGFLAG